MIADLETFVVPIDNLFSYSQRISSTERLGKGYQFVDNTPERPYICFFCVGLRLHNLWTRIQNGANEGLHDTSTLSSPLLGKSKISQLYIEITIN